MDTFISHAKTCRIVIMGTIEQQAPYAEPQEKYYHSPPSAPQVRQRKYYILSSHKWLAHRLMCL